MSGCGNGTSLSLSLIAAVGFLVLLGLGVCVAGLRAAWRLDEPSERWLCSAWAGRTPHPHTPTSASPTGRAMNRAAKVWFTPRSIPSLTGNAAITGELDNGDVGVPEAPSNGPQRPSVANHRNHIPAPFIIKAIHTNNIKETRTSHRSLLRHVGNQAGAPALLRRGWRRGREELNGLATSHPPLL